MNTHLVGKRAATAVVFLAAFAAAGVGLARATVPQSHRAAAEPLALQQGVLRSNELHGFVSAFCPIVVTDAGRWARGQLSSAALRRNGFVAGVREELLSQERGADAVSVVAQFSDTSGARHEVQDEFASARRSAHGFAAFSVPGVPGARGFTLRDRGRETYSVLFSDGRFQYLVRAGFGSGASDAASRARLIAVATGLHGRV
jgi:hypothetical protein